MPRAAWAGESVYIAAERFVGECLRRNGSLFTPGEPVWAAGPIDDFYTRFVENEKLGSGRFIEKLEQQLEGAPDKTIQLAAEVLFFNYLCENDTGPEHKRRLVHSVLGLMAQSIAVPPELDEAFSRGLARIGLAKTQKWQQLAFLLGFTREWKKLEGERRDALLVDSGEFRAFVHSLPRHSASVQIEGLLHLVFPDPFEPIVSPNVKCAIVVAFEDCLEGSEANVDEQLEAIRRALTEEYGEGFGFYDPELTEIWGGSSQASFGAWLVRGAAAFGSNLIPRWLDEGFVSISREEEGDGRPGASVDDVIRATQQFHSDKTTRQLRNGAISAIRFVDRIALGDLILTVDPDDLVYVGRVVGGLEWVTGDTPGTARRRAVEWLNIESPATRDALSNRLRRLMRQNTVIDLTAAAEDVAALIPAIVEPPEDDDPGVRRSAVVISPVTAALADGLLLPQAWLQEAVDLLNEKRQTIFFGPPGTGKTFIAQALANHVASHGGTSELVQFHAAYKL